jgi:DNA-binding transcriptional LysR family regulator
MEPGIVLAREAANGEVGHLSIGDDAAAEFRVFPQIVLAFRKVWPHVHLSFNSMKNSQQPEGLRRDALDLSFVFLPVPDDEFEVTHLTSVPLVVALPADHRLAAAPVVSIKDLSQPLILFPRSLDPDTYKQIKQMFMAAGSAMNVVVETAIFFIRH